MTENLSIIEVEVREARAKLAKDLTVLRSPQTYRDFRSGLKSEAQSMLQRITEDLKARAAANPSAALAIGAGVAWRLLRHPPIATALIGAGVLSLWRTTTVRVDEDDYLSTAQQRFGEQVSEAVDTVKDYATETVITTRGKGECLCTFCSGERPRAQRLCSRTSGRNVRKGARSRGTNSRQGCECCSTRNVTIGSSR